MAVPPSPCESCQPSAPRVYQIFVTALIVRSLVRPPRPAPRRRARPTPHVRTADFHTGFSHLTGHSGVSGKAVRPGLRVVDRQREPG